MPRLEQVDYSAVHRAACAGDPIWESPNVYYLGIGLAGSWQVGWAGADIDLNIIMCPPMIYQLRGPISVRRASITLSASSLGDDATYGGTVIPDPADDFIASKIGDGLLLDAIYLL